MQKRDTLADIACAIGIGAILACLLAAYFDVLVK